MASPFKTNAVNETIDTGGGAGQGRDYTDPDTWEGDTDVDHVTLNRTDVLEWYADETSFDVDVGLGGSTNDATRCRIIRAAPGEEHDGTPGNGVQWHSTGSVDTVNIVESDASIENLSLKFNGSSSSSRYCIIFNANSNNSRAVNCIAADSLNNGTGATIDFRAANDDTRFVHCLSHNSELHGFYCVGVIDAQIYNCTATDAGNNNFVCTSDNLRLKNCLANNATGPNFLGTPHADSTNNASDTTSIAGSNGRTSQTFSFVDEANDDFHLGLNDAGAKGFGADLSSDADAPFDITPGGATITSWSIGFHQPQASTAATVLYHHLI